MGLMKITSVLLTYIQGSFVMMPVNKLLKYDLRGRKKYLTWTNIWICRLGNSEPPENLWQLKHICQMCFKFIYYLWFIAVYKHTDLGTRLNPLSTLRAWSTMATCIFPIGSTGLINYPAYWPIYKQVTVRISLRLNPPDQQILIQLSLSTASVQSMTTVSTTVRLVLSDIVRQHENLSTKKKKRKERGYRKSPRISKCTKERVKPWRGWIIYCLPFWLLVRTQWKRYMMVSSKVHHCREWACPMSPKLKGDPNKTTDTELGIHSLGEVGRQNLRLDNQAMITLSLDL